MEPLKKEKKIFIGENEYPSYKQVYQYALIASYATPSKD